MAKKAQSSMRPGLSMRHVLCLGWKLVILVSLALCVLAFIRIQHYSQHHTVSTASAVVKIRSRVLADHFTGNPKVAFLFLVRRNLPLDFLWGSFFENVDRANFSIYVHSEPGFVYDESTTVQLIYDGIGSVLQQVAWAEASMVEAERLLFEEALRDPANQRFVLLSDSCVPLYNFSYIYSYLMGSPKSFVESFINKRDVRYNPKISPVIPKEKWRKGSQWVSLIRGHAQLVVDDKIVFPVFRKFCKRRLPVDASLGKKNLKYQHDCVSDEHYVQTLFAMNDLDAELKRRTVTFSLWNQPRRSTGNITWHPFTFSYQTSGPQQIEQIKDITVAYYEAEFRVEPCSNNSTSVPCYLQGNFLEELPCVF